LDLSILPDFAMPDLRDHDYPPGPYGDPQNGINVGDVVPNMTFQGYWAPKQTSGLASGNPFGEVTLGMLHDSGAKYALLELGAFY